MNEVVKQLTHKQAATRAAEWLRNSIGCNVVLRELSCMGTREIPDALGFKGGRSILVECKVNRSDFLADKNKGFRSEPEKGMGDTRYFACPPGLIDPSEVPNGWGLLFIHPRRIIIEKEPEGHESNKADEVKLLVAVIRRLEISTAVFVRQEPVGIDGAVGL